MCQSARLGLWDGHFDLDPPTAGDDSPGFNVRAFVAYEGSSLRRGLGAAHVGRGGEGVVFVNGAIDERKRPALPSPNYEEIPCDQAVALTTELLKDLITCWEEDEDALIARIWQEGGKQALIAVVRGDSQLINVRAQAARLLIANPNIDERIFKELREHRSSMIRAGVLLGAEDAGNFARVAFFLEDASPSISEEAKEIIEDAGF